MAKERGWWVLKTNVEIDYVDREYIASLIQKGYSSGQIVEEESVKDSLRKTLRERR